MDRKVSLVSVDVNRGTSAFLKLLEKISIEIALSGQFLS